MNSIVVHLVKRLVSLHARSSMLSARLIIFVPRLEVVFVDD